MSDPPHRSPGRSARDGSYQFLSVVFPFSYLPLRAITVLVPTIGLLERSTSGADIEALYRAQP
jgi:hypothetical protein